MSTLVNLLEYYPLALAAMRLGCEEIELLLLAHAGEIAFHQYPDPTNLIGCENVSGFEIGAIIIKGTKTGKQYQHFTADLDIEKTDLVLTKTEFERAYYLLNPEAKCIPVDNIPRVHGNRENNARWRERVLLAAGYVKIHYPKDCKNKHGRETLSAWADALINHWHLFGNDHDIPEKRVATEIIGDISRLPANRKRAGKSAP